MPSTPKPPTPKSSLDDTQMAKLRAESKAPLRGLRQFFYVTFAASALLGAFIFLFQLLGGADPKTTGYNIVVQFVVFGVMVALWRADRSRSS